MKVFQAGLAGDENIFGRLKPQQFRCRALVGQIQGGPEGTMKQRAVGNHFSAGQGLQVLDHGPVAGDTPRKNNGSQELIGRKEGIKDVARQAQAESVTDLSQAAAFLLGVNQVGFSEHGAA